MYIDNFSNPPTGFGSPTIPFSTPIQPPVSEEAAKPVQTPIDELPVSEPVAAPKPAPAANEERPEGFIEGWDEFDLETYDFSRNAVQIKVFGVGGGGCNAVNRMYRNGEKSAEMVVVNTDIPVLRSSPVKKKVAIGRLTTRGYGAGSCPEKGCAAAEESHEVIRRMLQGTDLLYITAGMGGGTGTGASPVIARIAKEMDILTIAVVTKPFAFEGATRMAQAEDGINKLRQWCDAVIVVPNEKLLTLSEEPLSMQDAFDAADEILIKSVQCICRIINDESYINLDFADVLTTLRDAGDAHIGIGVAEGPGKAMAAAHLAINSPLLETSINEADGMIISVIANDVPLHEIDEAAKKIGAEAAPNARIIWGIKFDPSIGDKIEITVIATKKGTPKLKNIEPVKAPFEVPVATATDLPEIIDVNEEPDEPQAIDLPIPQAIIAPDNPEPVEQPKQEAPAQAPSSPFYTELDWKLLQGVAMRNKDKK